MHINDLRNKKLHDLKNKELHYLMEIKNIMLEFPNRTDDDIALIDKLINRKTSVKEVAALLLYILNNKTIQHNNENGLGVDDLIDSTIDIIKIVDSNKNELGDILSKNRKSIDILEKQSVAMSIMAKIEEKDKIAIANEIRNRYAERSVINDVATEIQGGFKYFKDSRPDIQELMGDAEDLTKLIMSNKETLFLDLEEVKLNG